MARFTLSEHTILKTSLQPIVDDQRTVLILGTMPGEKSIALQQYYGNRGNHFWKILFTVLGEDFTTDYEIRKAVLSKHKIGLWNVLMHCQRKGSQDSAIMNERANDFESFFSIFPNIKYVFFESKGAARFYKKYASEKQGVVYTTLPSTSGLNAGLSYAEKLMEWQQLGGILSKEI